MKKRRLQKAYAGHFLKMQRGGLTRWAEINHEISMSQLRREYVEAGYGEIDP